MPVEVEDIAEKSENTQEIPENIQEKSENTQEIPEIIQETSQLSQSAPKKRGRPAGAKNKPKAEPVPKAEPAPKLPDPKPKARKKAVVVPPPSSESEEEEPPPSPSTQRRNQWVAYRQKQVDAFQARQAHYTRSVDKILGF